MDKTVMKTEKIIDKINDRPSIVVFLIAACVLSNKLLGPFLSYYPNFCGYIPYSDWRCNSNSSKCLDSTSSFFGYGWESVSEDLIYADSRCRVQLAGLDPHSIVIKLYTTEETFLGNISIDISNNAVTVQSNEDCRESCSSVVNGELSSGLEEETAVCEMEHGVTGTGTTLKCNDTDHIALGDVTALKNAVDTVRLVKLSGVSRYQLFCPDSDQYSSKTLCDKDSDLQIEADFHWETRGRTSYAMDWNLQCGREYLSTLLTSVYYIGAIVGLLSCGIISDMRGRRFAAVVGMCLALVGTVLAATSPSYWVLMGSRLVQGAGRYMVSTASYLLVLEFTASKHRAFLTSFAEILWSIGYILVAISAYLLYSWRWLLWLTAILFIGATIPLFLIPESPRFYFSNKNDEASAKESLQWLAERNGVEIDLKNIEIEKNRSQEEDQGKEQPGLLETLREFIKYREMTIQLVTQMLMWFIASFLYFGFGYSWSKLGKDIYLSYVFAAVGELIAYIAQNFPLTYLGRKKSMILYFVVAGVTFLVALIPADFGNNKITLEQFSCLVGSMFVASAFSSLYLYTAELAPDSQRGKMLSLCSTSARMGAFLSPQANLLFEWNKQATLVLFAVLSTIATFVPLRLPETRGQEAPTSAAEIQERKDNASNKKREKEPTNTTLQNDSIINDKA